MFKITALVEGSQLAKVLEGLHALKVDASVEVSVTNPVSTNTTSRRTVKVKSHKRKSTRGKHGKPFDTDRMITAIEQRGLGSFSLVKLREQAANNGIHPHTCYRAVNRLISQGKLVKLKPGLYRRTALGISGLPAVASG